MELVWQRIRRSGREDASAAERHVFTLRPGELLVVERIQVPARGTCGARLASLDLHYREVR